MKLKYLLPIFLTIALITSTVAAQLVLQLRQSLDNVAKTQNRRFKSTLLADELRQSSDDLTKFARIFVQTGDEKFKEYFYQVLAIRDGKMLRPNIDGTIYWDFITTKKDSPLSVSYGQAVSFPKKMIQLNFSQEEFELLEEAKRRSDNLAKIENRAFYALKGRYWDESTKDYTRPGPVNKKLATSLLYDDNYFETKALIMEPIAKFQKNVNSRTAIELELVHKHAETIIIKIFVAMGSLVSILLMLYLTIHRRVILRTSILAKTALQITEGDLNVRSKIVGKDELGIFGLVFDKMVAQLSETLKFVTTAKSRMEDELNVARDIQMSMIPLTFPAYPEHLEFDIFAKLIPAREVGGDFYDFYFIDEDHFCLTVGDVSGKGVPAALMMAVCRSLLKSRAQDDLSTASIVTHVNKEMAEENINSMFVTIFMGVLNIKTGRMVFTNAGHNPTLIRNKKGEVRKISTLHGPVVGAVEGYAYKESTIDIKLGDAILAYTDGVTDACNQKNEMYSEERLITFMSEHTLNSSLDFLADLQKDVIFFEDGAEPFDDITTLCLRFLLEVETQSVCSEKILIKNVIGQIPIAIDQLEKFIEENNLSDKFVAKWGIALDEILSNIIKYAYPDNGEHDIFIGFELYQNILTVTIKDNGIPFNPFGVKTPDVNLSVEKRKLGGLGIHLVKNLMDEFHYKRNGDKNIVTLIKYNMEA